MAKQGNSSLTSPIDSTSAMLRQLDQYEPDLTVPTATNIDNIISGIAKDEKEIYEQALINFVVKEHKTFDICETQDAQKREQLWKALTNLAAKTDDNNLLVVVFTVFRILSRDKQSVSKLATPEWMDLMISHIGLNSQTFEYSDDTLCKIEEGQKVVWNVLFNSKKLVNESPNNGLLDKLLDRMSLYDKVRIPDAIKYYDAQFIFYLTTSSTDVRRVVEESNGLPLLITVLKVVLKEASESGPSSSLPVVLDNRKADIACESLKALFSITLTSSGRDEKVKQYRELVDILRSYLVASTASLDKTWQLRRSCINMLVNIPAKCYRNLITPVAQSTSLPKSLQFESHNMIIIHEILMFLEAHFMEKLPVTNQLEQFAPVLSVLLKGVTTHRPIRKYLRTQILPPLTEMDKRPEETDTIRGHLCKLLTSPITQLRDLAAELLFVLCKCNVNRMIKYTGFGNAAGLLAQKGLLGGKKDAAEADYSSGSEDSETEEYTEQRHLLNPVLGCVDKPHPDPMAGMSDEQKEYEAVKLAQRIDELSKSGIIQPCRVGSDGKPQPIKHILELQEGLTANNDDSNIFLLTGTSLL
ncbi:synembryn-A isoform X4 [Dendroctonus ponderosae]|uniref:synembryn-A isoform X4 n=1 Tax=Dendroctonus ponderosae TaxID=77166 RepID=UPI0020352975|nr:synembryn-A isoform X4 [Dendroctonus ponderosae]